MSTTNPFDEIKEELIEIKEKLSSLQRHPEQKTEKKTLNLDEAANYTGLTKSYIYKLSAKSGIPCYKPEGKRLFFDKQELDAWLKRNKKKTQEEIESEAETYITKKNAK